MNISNKILVFCMTILFNINTNAQNSILGSGNIYKIKINKTGIQKLDFDDLKDLEGLNISSINPKQIAIYGNGGRMLPEQNDEERPLDLVENAILVVGESDGKFDNKDKIIFYAEGRSTQYYNETRTNMNLKIICMIITIITT